MRIIIPVILSFFLTGCFQKQDMNKKQKTAVDSTALKSTLNIPNYEVGLLPEARNITEGWLAFITAQAEIENFRTYTVQEVSVNATPIAEIMLSLKDSAPTQLNSNAVQTRLSVLYTKAKVLETLANKRNPDYTALKSAAEEIPVEFNNFKIQLNELFLKTLEDLEDELDAFDVEDTTSRPLLRTPTAINPQN